jgi:hypothetical protein
VGREERGIEGMVVEVKGRRCREELDWEGRRRLGAEGGGGWVEGRPRVKSFVVRYS